MSSTQDVEMRAGNSNSPPARAATSVSPAAASPPALGRARTTPSGAVRKSSSMLWMHSPLSTRTDGTSAPGSTESLDRLAAGDVVALPPNVAEEEEEEEVAEPAEDAMAAASSSLQAGDAKPVLAAEDRSGIRVTREKVDSGGVLRQRKPANAAVFARNTTFADADVGATLAASGAAEKDALSAASAGCLARAGVKVSLHGQMFVFLVVHALATLGVFFHFFTKKWLQREAAVPAGAPNYWQKRVVPSLEFGAMHSLLFTMALLPLTMCRFTIARLRNTWVSRFLPLDYMTEFHKYLGYIMGIQLVATILVFFGHFGSLCQAHKDGVEKTDFCLKFTEEIMITGYVILGTYLIMWFTSLYFIRGRRHYEVFYYVHHLFVGLYVVLIMHTFDAQARSGELNRSQAWPWVAGPLAYYFADRAVVAATSHRTQLAAARLFYYPRAVALDIRKPAGFTYKAGQFVQVNVPGVSRMQWHPFSVASAPDDEHVRLLIKAEPGGWTERLFDKLHERQGAVRRVESTLSQGSIYNRDMADVDASQLADLDVWLMGPFGAPTQDVRLYEYAVLMSSGTGVVPMISQLRDILHRFKVLNVHRSTSGRFETTVSPPADGSHAATASSSSAADQDGSALGPPSPLGSVSASPGPSPSITPGVSPRGGGYVQPGSRADAATDPGVPDWAARGLRKLEGTRYALYNLVLLCADLCLFLVTLNLVGNGVYTSWRHDILQVATGVTTVLYCAECPFRVAALVSAQGLGSKRSLRGLVDAFFCMPMLIVFFVYLLEFDVHPSYQGDGLVYLLFASAFYVYRVLWRWYTNPFAVRGSSHIWLPPSQNTELAAELKRHELGRVRRIKFLWTCRTLNMLRWLQDELAEVQDDAHELCPGMIDIQVHVTSSHLSQDVVDRAVEGTGLEGRVVHARPLLGPTFVHLRNKLHKEVKSRDRGARRARNLRVGVFFSGNLSLEWEVEQLATNLASTSRVRFFFHTENDTIQWLNRKFDDTDVQAAEDETNAQALEYDRVTKEEALV